MKKEYSIPTSIRDGKVVKNRTLLKKVISSFEGSNVTISVKKEYKKRSVQQNAFYWGVWIPIFQEELYNAWGEMLTEEEVHEILKSQCNYREVANPTTGEIEKFPQSTKHLTTVQWLEYEQRIRQFALDFFQMVLPEPNEQQEMNFKNIYNNGTTRNN